MFATDLTCSEVSRVAARLAVLALSAVACSAAAPAVRSLPRGPLTMSAPVIATQPATQLPNIADLLDNLSRMNKPEREKILAKMPSETSQRIEKGLEQLDGMGPVQKQEALERFHTFMTLDTHGRDVIRNAISSYHTLPVRRQNALQVEMSVIHKMSKAQRDHHLASDEFKSRFSADERAILEKLTLVMRTD